MDRKAECSQLNIAHVARKKETETLRKETKTTKRASATFSVQVQNPWTEDSPTGTRKTREERFCETEEF